MAEDLYNKGYAVALFGGKDDKESLDEFASLFKYPYFDFAYKTSLKELPAILSAVDLLLSNDSGAMHIAIAAGTPAVAVFGPTVKSLGFFPYDEKSIVVENNDIDCRPCGKHGGNTCPKGHFKCMKDIEPERVLIICSFYFTAGLMYERNFNCKVFFPWRYCSADRCFKICKRKHCRRYCNRFAYIFPLCRCIAGLSIY